MGNKGSYRFGIAFSSKGFHMAISIGKLIKSNAHTDYVCQVYGPNEVKTPPTPADYAFGTFVRMELVGHGDLVGLIYDTQLHNPDFGNLGPRLSPTPDLEVFSPDYLAEKVTLVGIMAIGLLNGDEAPTHGVPPLSAQIDMLVERMGDEAVKRFHSLEPNGVQVGYAPLILSQDNPIAHHLLIQILNRLSALFPDQETKLSVLRRELNWQSHIRPTGGLA
jgi:hypothetical protein